MKQREITPDDIEEWAAENDYSDEDLANFAGILQVGQLLLSHLAPEAKEDFGDDIDEAYEALFQASPLDADDDLPEPMEDYLPKMALDWTDIRDVVDEDDVDAVEKRLRITQQRIRDSWQEIEELDVPREAVDELWDAQDNVERAIEILEDAD